jgi:hypothetical protein
MLVRVTDERSRRPIRRIDILRSDSQNLVTRLLPGVIAGGFLLMLALIAELWSIGP